MALKEVLSMFDGKGLQAEQLAVRQFKGEACSNLTEQYKDIDLTINHPVDGKKSFSVKDQKDSSGKYGGIQIELKLTDTVTGQSIDGCFLNNQSDWYLWRITHSNKDTWFSVETSKFKDWVETNKQSFKKWCTRESTEAYNKRLGRKYNRAEGLTIPLSLLTASGIGRLIPVMNK